jgi:GrpB-like predicted nucleotidyltransferase (UPF0157 family)
MVNPHEDQLAIVDSRYDEWRACFERERDRVIDALESAELDTRVRRIEHVGSTSVPDLGAKDIVDLDIVVDDDAVAAVSRAIESELGGTRYENSETWHPVFREENGQRFNDHVFAASGDGWKVSIATVAVLRDRPDLRSEYEQLKRETASETDDLETYGTSKSEFIGEVLDAAREMDDLDLAFEVPSSR